MLLKLCSSPPRVQRYLNELCTTKIERFRIYRKFDFADAQWPQIRLNKKRTLLDLEVSILDLENSGFRHSRLF